MEKIHDQQRGDARRVISLIVAIPVVIILMSSVLYYMANNQMIDMGTVNNGELVDPPLQFSALPLTDLDGNPLEYMNISGEAKWSFVVVGGRDCLDSCERMLYLTRQTHTALERRYNRMQKIYVSLDGGISSALQKTLDDDYKSTTAISIDSQAVTDLFADSDIDPQRENSFFIVDEHGWLMMAYQADDLQQTTLNTLGKAVIRDMKRLLK